MSSPSVNKLLYFDLCLPILGPVELPTPILNSPPHTSYHSPSPRPEIWQKYIPSSWKANNAERREDLSSSMSSHQRQRTLWLVSPGRGGGFMSASHPEGQLFVLRAPSCFYSQFNGRDTNIFLSSSISCRMSLFEHKDHISIHNTIKLQSYIYIFLFSHF